MDAGAQLAGDLTHYAVGVLLEGGVVGFERDGLADVPEEIRVEVEVVAVVMGCGDDLHVLAEAISLGGIERHSHTACGEATEVVSLRVSGLWEYDDGLSAVDAFCDEVEGLEVPFQSLAAFPSEAVGRQQANPVEVARRQRMQGEDVGPCQRVDVIVQGQREGDVERVVGGVLVVGNDEIALAVGGQMLQALRIATAHKQRLVDEAQVAFVEREFQELQPGCLHEYVLFPNAEMGEDIVEGFLGGDGAAGDVCKGVEGEAQVFGD